MGSGGMSWPLLLLRGGMYLPVVGGAGVGGGGGGCRSELQGLIRINLGRGVWWALTGKV